MQQQGEEEGCGVTKERRLGVVIVGSKSSGLEQRGEEAQGCNSGAEGCDGRECMLAGVIGSEMGNFVPWVVV